VLARRRHRWLRAEEPLAESGCAGRVSAREGLGVAARRHSFVKKAQRLNMGYANGSGIRTDEPTDKGFVGQIRELPRLEKLQRRDRDLVCRATSASDTWRLSRASRSTVPKFAVSIRQEPLVSLDQLCVAPTLIRDTTARIHVDAMLEKLPCRRNLTLAFVEQPAQKLRLLNWTSLHVSEQGSKHIRRLIDIATFLVDLG